MNSSNGTSRTRSESDMESSVPGICDVSGTYSHEESSEDEGSEDRRREVENSEEDSDTGNYDAEEYPAGFGPSEQQQARGHQQYARTTSTTSSPLISRSPKSECHCPITEHIQSGRQLCFHWVLFWAF